MELSAAQHARIAAVWPPATARFYAIDNETGSDANAGYSDVSMAAAGAVALKTWSRLLEILPRNGQGRRVVIALKGRSDGGNYKDPDGTTNSHLTWRGFHGYAGVWFRGTSDFSDDTTDRIKAGYKIALAGPNGDQSWSVGTVVDTLNFTVAAGTLSAEPGILYKRIRFTTGALANTTRVIHANTSTQLTFYGTASPAPGDQFMIEEPGVVFDKVAVQMDGFSGIPAPEALTNFGPIVLRGIQASNTGSQSWEVNGHGRRLEVSGCETKGNCRFDGSYQLTVVQGYFSETGTFVTPTGSGGASTGFRAAGAGTFTGVAITSWGSSAVVGAASFSRLPNLAAPSTAGGGGYFGAGISIRNQNVSQPVIGLSNGSTGNQLSVCMIGMNYNDAGFPKTRVVGSILIVESSVRLVGLDISNAGANPAVRVEGSNQVVVFDNCTGTGNTDVVVDLAKAMACKLLCRINSASTLPITATLGGVRFANGAIGALADLDVTNVVDNGGNDAQGLAGRVVSSCIPVTNQSGGALVVGNLVRGNGTAAQVTKAQADTEANASGVLGVMVTAPASGALGFVSNDARHAVRMDAAATPNALCYLSEATAGQGKSTPPPSTGTNQKLRHGWIVSNANIGGVEYAYVAWQTELLPQLSDGVAP